MKYPHTDNFRVCPKCNGTKFTVYRASELETDKDEEKTDKGVTVLRCLDCDDKKLYELSELTAYPVRFDLRCRAPDCNNNRWFELDVTVDPEAEEPVARLSVRCTDCKKLYYDADELLPFSFKKGLAITIRKRFQG